MDQRARQLLWLAVVSCVGVIYIYPLALPTPLLDPDEGLHASIAQEMVERGDYVIPRFCGEPFRDKPIVYFAAQALSLQAFGMNEAAVRLPGVLFSLLGCLTTALLASRLYDKEAAAYALVAALTLVLPLMLTQSPAHDIALVPAINLLALCFWEQEQAATAGRRWYWLVGGALCVAAALLTKGLIGIAVFAVGIGLYSLVTRSISWRLVRRSVFVVVCGAVLAAPWFLAMEAASPGYLNYYFIHRHLFGFVTEAQTHGEAPWYYYALPVLGGAMPWLLYSLAAVVQSFFDERGTKENRATALLACWFVGGFLFLSTANSKLMTYSLPLFPPVAILAGLAFHRFFRGTLSSGVDWSVAWCFRSACLIGIFGPVVTLMVFDHFIEAPSPAAAYFLAGLAGLLIATGWAVFESGQRRAGFALGVLWFPALFAALMNGPFPVCVERHSQRGLALEIAKIRPLPDEVVIIGEEPGSVLFYLTAADRAWFRDGHITESDGRVLDRLANLPTDWVVAITDKELTRTLHADEVRQKWPVRAGNFRIIDCTGLSVSDSRANESPIRR